MAKVYNQAVPTLDVPAYRHVIKPANRFTNISVRRKGFFNVRKNRKNLMLRSFLFEISALWRGFSSLEKSAWDSAGAVMNMSGYKAFVQDQSLRIKASLSGTSTPSNFHQGLVGHAYNFALGDTSGIMEQHKPTYYILRKVFNAQNQYEPVLITEFPTAPLTISFNFKSEMVFLGDDVSVVFYVFFYGGDEGGTFLDLYSDYIDPNTDWDSFTHTFSSLPFGCTAYDVLIVFYSEGGDFWIDNFSAFHSGQNWAKDPLCERFGERFVTPDYDFFPSWQKLLGYGDISIDSIFP